VKENSLLLPLDDNQSVLTIKAITFIANEVFLLDFSREGKLN
jgi:hypothetical protein